MKTKELIIGTLAIGLLATAAVPATQAFGFGKMFGGKDTVSQGQNENSDFGGMHRGGMRGGKGGMTGGFEKSSMEVSTEMKSLFDQLRTAQEAKDTAKVTELREKIKTQRDIEMKAKEAAMDTAIAGGYETWKKYMTDQGAPEEMFTKITADNFATFTELHNLKKQEQALEEKLGIGGGMMGGQHMFLKGR